MEKDVAETRAILESIRQAALYQTKREVAQVREEDAATIVSVSPSTTLLLFSSSSATGKERGSSSQETKAKGEASQAEIQGRPDQCGFFCLGSPPPRRRRRGRDGRRRSLSDLRGRGRGRPGRAALWPQPVSRLLHRCVEAQVCGEGTRLYLPDVPPTIVVERTRLKKKEIRIEVDTRNVFVPVSSSIKILVCLFVCVCSSNSKTDYQRSEYRTTSPFTVHEEDWLDRMLMHMTS